MKITINITPEEESAMRQYLTAVIIGGAISKEETQLITSVISKVFVAVDPGKKVSALVNLANKHHTHE